MKKRVVIGLSGGVDSSVAALLLKKQGYEVIGLFMRNWDSLVNNDIKGHLKPQTLICSQEQDYQDAEKVAKKLDIPLHRADFIKEYWDEVFVKFIEEYKKSNTPNPDLFCNKYIKFNYFLKYALKEFQADFIATGHYAKVSRESGQAQLLKCADSWKDQTYFLAGLKSSQLEKVLFPLAEIEDKSQVREIAKKHDLITFDKKDSTGICFIGKRKIKDFLQNYIEIKTGDIICKETGKILGKHDGTMFYSIGQRFGLNVGGLPEPIFVCDKDIEKNIIYTAPLSLEEKYLFSTSCSLKDINWIYDEEPQGQLTVKFTHGDKEYPCTLSKEEGKITISYQLKRAVTPGQACVIYDKELCLGMGIVNEVFKNNKKMYGGF